MPAIAAFAFIAQIQQMILMRGGIEAEWCKQFKNYCFSGQLIQSKCFHSAYPLADRNQAVKQGKEW